MDVDQTVEAIATGHPHAILALLHHEIHIYPPGLYGCTASRYPPVHALTIPAFAGTGSTPSITVDHVASRRFQASPGHSPRSFRAEPITGR